VAHGFPRIARLWPKPINPSALPTKLEKYVVSIWGKWTGIFSHSKPPTYHYKEWFTLKTLKLSSHQPTAIVYTSERHHSKMNRQKLLQEPQYHPLNLASLLGINQAQQRRSLHHWDQHNNSSLQESVVKLLLHCMGEQQHLEII
jgi:hypothetical protein